VGLVAVGLWYTLRGYAVPQAAINSVLVVAAIGGCAAWLVGRFGTEPAAKFADHYFRLHDSISSYLHFSRQGRTGGFYNLQAEQVTERVAQLDSRSIAYHVPRRGIVLGICLLAVAVPLSLMGPSAAVVQRQLLEEQTEQATTVINEELEKQVEKLAEETVDPNEEELLNPNRLRELVDQLTSTPDQKEALRQYAKLERQLNEARLAVQNKEQEQLLARAAEQLEQSRETQDLAEKLQQKDFESAAEQLEQMAPQATQPLDQQRKELARLKATAQRMAAAAKAMKAANTPSASPNPSDNQSVSSSSQASAGRNGSGGAGSASGGGQEMAATMEALDKAVANLDRALQDALRQQQQFGQMDERQAGECQECQGAVLGQLSSLGSQMRRLAMMGRIDEKLSQLVGMCSQCQGGLCEAASALCQSPNPGGLEPGAGSSWADRKEITSLVDNGNTSQLQGLKGEGPSQTSVEAADEGSGVSTRKATARQVTYQRQFESFVQREDVPEQVKEGVKQYFQIIHAASDTAPSDTENAANERVGN
jgi:hypothetical protein